MAVSLEGFNSRGVPFSTNDYPQPTHGDERPRPTHLTSRTTPGGGWGKARELSDKSWTTTRPLAVRVCTRFDGRQPSQTPCGQRRRGRERQDDDFRPGGR